MAQIYIGTYIHNGWCRHPRPNRPFGHCLIPAINCPVTLNLAWCLVFEEKDIVMGEIRKVKVWVGILKGPRKRVLCSLMKARELPRGTHLPGFPTMCTALLYKLWGIFKCVLKLPARADAKSQELQLNRGKVTLFAFKGLFSRVNFQMCPEIAWLSRGRVTMVAFKGFSNVFWNYLIEQRQSHIICIRMTFFWSGFLDVLSKSLIEQRQSHTASIWGTFLQSEFSDVS